MSAHSTPASPRRRDIRHGFTMVELLVIITIVALLASMLLPALQQTREVTTRLRCASVMRGLGVMTLTYSNEYKGAYPCTYDDYDPSTYGTTLPNNYAVDSLNALWSYSSGNMNAFFCPTVLQRSYTSYGAYARAIVSQSTNQDYLPALGYQKFVGTINPADISGAYTAARYYTASAMSRDPNWPTSTGSQYPCYLNSVQVETATRTRVHLGNRGQPWSSAAYNGNWSSTTSKIWQPPSQIAFWGDPWSGNGAGQGIVSHTSNFIANAGPYPIGYTGKNEVMSDGHVTWYGVDNGNLYFTFNGQSGAVLVQDDQ